MEASLLAVTPAPMPQAAPPAQSIQGNEESTPFSDLLAAASNGHDNQEEMKSPSDETANPAAIPDAGQDDMAAELTALAFQNMPALPVRQLQPGQESATAPVLSISLITTQAIDQSSSLIPENPAIADLGGSQQVKTMTDEMPDMMATFPSSGKNNNSLIDRQIHSILHGTNQEAIVIQTSTQQPVTAESLNGLTSPHLQSPESNTVSTQVTIAPNQSGTPEVSADTVESLREDMGRHAADAKVEALKDQRQAGNQQQPSGQQENSTNQQNMASMPLDASPGNSEPMSQFIVTGLGTQTAATTPGHTTAAHPANLPSGMPVPAEEVINHLVERFSINPRLQTSKVSLNLSPAELGELKIDIMVKGDSIKAHIAAGSQQIQETIERHMPKLKTVLEQQGFTVEDFQVTLESATTGSHDFFQQQFSSRRDFTPQTAAARGQSNFAASLNSAEGLLTGSLDSGINLNI